MSACFPSDAPAVVSAEIVELANSFAEPLNRETTAGALGRLFGAESLLIFVRDPEVELLLPVAGLPQTLPEAAQWHAFVDLTLQHGRHTGQVHTPNTEEPRPAVGVACSGDMVLVIVGTTALHPGVLELRALSPLLLAAFRAEQQARNAQAQAALAIQNASRSLELLRQLDELSGRLQHALADAATAREQLEASNRELVQRTADLQSANAVLAQQADELGAQAVELELQAEALARANEELAEAKAAAEAANRAKSDFLSTMSHELRTPLNAIGGYVQLLELGIHGPLTAAQAKSLASIQRSQLHLLRLINEVLSMARIEAGRVPYHITEVAVASVVAGLTDLVQPQLGEKQLTYEVRPIPDNLAVRADVEKLEQILLNLLSNAVKFTDAGGRIAVSASSTPAGQVSIIVEDTGRGIPANKLSTIFEPFVQVHTGLRRPTEGTGLGLAISRDLARGMGGDLTARSELGVGSQFELTLPAAPSTSEPLG